MQFYITLLFQARSTGFVLRLWAALFALSFMMQNALATSDEVYLFKQSHYKYGDELVYVCKHGVRLILAHHPVQFMVSEPSWILYAVCPDNKTYCDLSQTKKFLPWHAHELQAKPVQKISIKGLSAVRLITIPRKDDAGWIDHEDISGERKHLSPMIKGGELIKYNQVDRENCLNMPKQTYDALNRLAGLDLDPGVPLNYGHCMPTGNVVSEFALVSVKKVPFDRASFIVPKNYRAIDRFSAFAKEAVTKNTEDIFKDLKIGDPFGTERMPK